MKQRWPRRLGKTGVSAVRFLLWAALLLVPAAPALAFDELDPWIDVYKMPLFFLDRITESTDQLRPAQRQTISGQFSVQPVSITVLKHTCTDTPCDLDHVRAVAASPDEPDEVVVLEERQFADRVIIAVDWVSDCQKVTVGLRDEAGGEVYPVTLKASICDPETDAVVAYLERAVLATPASNREDLAANRRNGLDYSAAPTEPREISDAWLDFESLAGFEVRRVGSLIGIHNHVFDDRQVIVGNTGANDFALMVFLNPCKWSRGQSERRSACNRRHIRNHSGSVAALENRFGVPHNGRSRKAIRTDSAFGASISYRNRECRGGFVGIDPEGKNYRVVVIATACGSGGDELIDYLGQARLSDVGKRVQAEVRQ